MIPSIPVTFDLLYLITIQLWVILSSALQLFKVKRQFPVRFLKLCSRLQVVVENNAQSTPGNIGGCHWGKLRERGKSRNVKKNEAKQKLKGKLKIKL
jgi:hypothetical protein